MVTLYLAGHDTTAATMQWMLFELGRNPGVQEKIRMDRRLVNAFIFETLRMWPPIAIIGREALEDVEIRGTHVPKNSILILSPYVIHRLEENFPEPELFRLERWEGVAPSRCPGYLPFGVGGRGCIGARLAHTELATFLNAFLDRARIGTPSEPEKPAKRAGLSMSPLNTLGKITSSH